MIGLDVSHYFMADTPKVLEAINHNSCLHKKIGIDKDGNIKNCPLMSEKSGIYINPALKRFCYKVISKNTGTSLRTK